MATELTGAALEARNEALRGRSRGSKAMQVNRQRFAEILRQQGEDL